MPTILKYALCPHKVSETHCSDPFPPREKVQITPTGDDQGILTSPARCLSCSKHSCLRHTLNTHTCYNHHIAELRKSYKFDAQHASTRSERDSIMIAGAAECTRLAPEKSAAIVEIWDDFFTEWEGAMKPLGTKVGRKQYLAVRYQHDDEGKFVKVVLLWNDKKGKDVSVEYICLSP